MPDDRKHGVPALLSFFIPGLGQLIKGQVMKSIGHFVAAAIAGALTFVGIGVILYPLVCVYSTYDAYNH